MNISPCDDPLQLLSLQPPMQVARWLDLPFLLDLNEMKNWLASLPSFSFYRTDCVLTARQAKLSQAEFFELYCHYLIQIKESSKILKSSLIKDFSLAMTIDSSCLYQNQVEPDRLIVRTRIPVIRMKPHFFSVSKIDSAIYSSSFSQEAFSFGLQLSHPQLFQDPNTGLAEKIELSERFPNTSLWKKAQQSIKSMTIPTPIWIDGVRKNLSLRLGRDCLTWINQYSEINNRGWHIGLKESATWDKSIL